MTDGRDDSETSDDSTFDDQPLGASEVDDTSDTDETEDDDRTGLIAPIGLVAPLAGTAAPSAGTAAPQLPAPQVGAAPQHLAPPETGATAPQHLASSESGATAPQHAAQAQVGPSQTGAQHAADVQSAGNAQHLQGGEQAANSQTAPAQHVAGTEHAADAVNEGHTGLHGPTTRSRPGVQRLRHLSKFKLAVAGGVVAAAAVVGVVVVAAQGDDKQAAPPPPPTVVVETTDPAVSSAPSTVVRAAATLPPVTAAPTTTEASTTTSTLPSGSGSYDVALGPTMVSGGGISTQVASGATGQWIFAGPCDGVGECAAGVPVDSVSAVQSGGGGLTVDSAGNYNFTLVPSGDGGYVANFTIDIPDESCGAVTANGAITVVGLPTGQFSGSYVLTAPASGDCVSVTISVDFTGTRAG